MMAQFDWPGRRRAHVQRCTFGLGLLAAGARRAERPQGEADMIPASFEYAVARDVADAIQLLASSGGEGKVLAGGQSLIPPRKFGLAQPAFLVDLIGSGDSRRSARTATCASARSCVRPTSTRMR